MEETRIGGQRGAAAAAATFHTITMATANATVPRTTPTAHAAGASALCPGPPARGAGGTHHGGVAAADQLADFVEDALAVDGLVERASLHDHRDRQQDLLPHVLLEAAKHRTRGETCRTPDTKCPPAAPCACCPTARSHLSTGRPAGDAHTQGRKTWVRIRTPRPTAWDPRWETPGASLGDDSSVWSQGLDVLKAAWGTPALSCPGGVDKCELVP